MPPGFDASTRLAVLGAGSLGRAILSRLASPSSGAVLTLAASARNPVDLGPSVRVMSVAEDASANRTLAGWADVVVVAVRPTQTIDLVREIAGYCAAGTIVVLLAIGVRVGQVQAIVGPDVGVVRAMPNTPVSIGRGVIGLSGAAGLSPAARSRLDRVLLELGTIVEVDDEQLDLLSVVSGAGPAYVTLLTEKWTDAARDLGFEREVAARLVWGTLEGTTHLLAMSADSPADLLADVASPGGATERAVAVLEDSSLDLLAERAMRAAFERIREISEEVAAQAAGDGSRSGG